MKFNPLNKTVLVRLDEQPKETPSGIILPDGYKNKQEKGKVVAAHGATGILPGINVIFPAYVGNDYEIDGVAYKIIKSEDLLGYLDD